MPCNIVYLLFLFVISAGWVVHAQEVCSPFGDTFYHEGIEYIPSKGLVVGRASGTKFSNGAIASISVVDTDGKLTPWTTEPPPRNQQY